VVDIRNPGKNHILMDPGSRPPQAGLGRDDELRLCLRREGFTGKPRAGSCPTASFWVRRRRAKNLEILRAAQDDNYSLRGVYPELAEGLRMTYRTFGRLLDRPL